MLFASVGYKVKLFDSEPTQIDAALDDMKKQLQKLEDTGYLRGHLTAAEQFSLISRCSSLAECVKDSIHIQVCSNIFKNI